MTFSAQDKDFLWVHMIGYPFVSLEKRSGLIINGGRVKERKVSDARRADVQSA